MDDTVKNPAETVQKSSILFSLKFKILSIAFVGIAGFAIYVGLITHGAQKNASLLQSLEERLYPVQALLVSALHHLRLTHSQLQDAVLTGDTESILSAAELAVSLENEITQVVMLDEDRADEYVDLLDSFNLYWTNASVLANDVISYTGDIDKLSQRGYANSLHYETLVGSLESLQKSHDLEFVRKIGFASESAERSVLLAYTTGVVAVLLVLLIAIQTARNIRHRIEYMVDSLRKIAVEDGDLKVRLSLVGRDEMTELSFWFNAIVGKLEDLSNRMTQDIKKIAFSDYLTGLPNRRRLFDVLEQKVSAEHQQDGFAVVMMDLDNFKPINDEFGHDAGDKMICDVANRLKQAFSVEPPNSSGLQILDSMEIVGRLGGDEFMAIVNCTENETELFRKIEAVKQQLEVPFGVCGKEFKVGVSIGISFYPRDANDIVELVGFADMAMYEAKLSGRNQYRVFDSDIARKATRANKIRNELKQAIDNDEFMLVYQPKYSLSDLKLVGSEALIRWNNPGLGFVSPAEFIPIAESSRIIIDIDHWVLDSVCAQIAQWKFDGCADAPVSINVSAMQIRDPDYHNIVMSSLRLHKLPASAIQLEITETSALDCLDIVKNNIRHLREEGISVAMDDFGAGHSSLLLLINCQLDVLKIDKSLVDMITVDSGSLSVVHSLVSLGQSLGIEIVAEGIESNDQCELLASINCDVGQGYYFSKPLSSEDFQSLVRSPDFDSTRIAI